MRDSYLNKISVTRIPMEYTDGYYLNISIDGKCLDEILHEHYPADNMLGLVPTLLSWLENENERKITWGKIIPEDNETIISPILMCGDDVDFWCTIIVAESTCVDNKIIWKRIGSDDTDDRGFHPDHVGQKVNWLDKVGPFVFAKEEYMECIDQFRKALHKVNG